MKKHIETLGLYLHIPFCVKKCDYCDFLSFPSEKEVRQKYVQALCREVSNRAEGFSDKMVGTVFLGGGTPSLLSIEEITDVMRTVRGSFQLLPEAEITLEMNPGTVTKEKLEVYQKLGINRLSIGLQSADNEELRHLGRIHTWETFLHTWKLVRSLGFTNVNIDLMSALPGQTMQSYQTTLQKVLELRPEHISAYSLIIEEGTVFYDLYEKNTRKSAYELPDEDTDRSMYELTERWLEKAGYHRYEISNYALKGRECRHNICYWKRGEYLGLGLGAASLLKTKPEDPHRKASEIRSSNQKDLTAYLKEERDWAEERIPLSLEDQMEEFMFLGLRMMEGVSEKEFFRQFGRSLPEVYGGKLEKLIHRGLLQYNKENGCYSLTNIGIDVSNQVFVEFLF